MIAIPNIDKPQNCQKCIDDCLNIPLDCYPDEYGENRKGEKIVCPIIEIVQCKDCKHRDPEDKKCDCGMFERQGCIFPVDDDYFCKYGERRTETLDERIKRGLEEWKEK